MVPPSDRRRLSANATVDENTAWPAAQRAGRTGGMSSSGDVRRPARVNATIDLELNTSPLRRGRRPRAPTVRPVLASPLAIYCADIGSMPNHRFGWACTDAAGDRVERHRGSAEIGDLVEIVAADIADGRAVALGLECPLYVPVPQQPLRLGTARIGEGNRSWSAGAGAGARATAAQPFLDWETFTRAGHGLFLWEAFVTDRAKAATHIDDATVAVTAFRDALPDVTAANAVTADRPLSLLGTALLWSGWSDDLALLHAP